MSEREGGPPQSEEPEEEEQEPKLPLEPTGLGPPHASAEGDSLDIVTPTGLGPPHMSSESKPIAPTGLGPPHAQEPIAPTGLGPPHAQEPIAPTGLGPPHAQEPIAPTGLGPPHAQEPIAPTGLGPPHAQKPIAPTGLGPPHAQEPIAPTGLGPPHAQEPIAPTGLGPPHMSADDASKDADDESGKPPEPPLPPPGPLDPTGLGPPHSPEPDAEEPPTPADKAVAQPPPLPPWLRTEPVGTPPAGSPGRIEAVHPAPPVSALSATPATTEAAALGATAATPEAPPAAPAAPTAPSTPSRPFGSALIPGVLFTLAGGSATAGGILALWQTDQFEFKVKALISGGIALVLLAAAVLLRLLRGSQEIRGLPAVVGIAFAAACLTFADNPASPTQHDTLLKFALVAGLVAVLGWFASMVVPSAVAGFLAAVALPAAVGAGVWLSISQPTIVEAYVAALGVGLALAALLPRVGLLRPHPTGLSWTLAGAAIAVAVPAVALTTRGDTVALAAGASASAALLLLAHGNRHVFSALGALAGLATLESVLVTRFVTESESGDIQLTRLVVVAIAGAALIVVVAAGVLLTGRGWSLPSWSLPVGLADLMLAASLALAVVALFSGPGDVPINPMRLNPAQMLPGSTTTSVAATLPAQ